MSSPASLEAVVEGLRREGHLPPASAAEAQVLVRALRETQPWYVRAMVGIGAWLASLLLIGFIAGFSLTVGGSLLVGLSFIAGAVLVRRQTAVERNDVVIQSTLAVSLAGQALFAWGVADGLARHEAEWACAAVALMNAVLFVAFPDRVHRVLMVLSATAALILLTYLLEWNALVPVVGPALAGGLVWLYRLGPELHARGRGLLIRPLEEGLMLASFGCLLLSAVYVIPELDSDFSFYPRPWISTLLLGALFLYVIALVAPAIIDRPAARPRRLLGGLALAVVAAGWWSPGLLLALTVILLGTARGHTTLAWTGIAFLALFVTAFFYGIEVPLPTKSITLVATGATVLLARRLLLHELGRQSRD